MENENLVLDNTENVDELATEELVDGQTDTIEVEEPKEEKTEEKSGKYFTDEELDDMFKKKLYRKENKIRDEYEKKYAKVEELLKAGLGTETFEEAVDNLESFYENKGIKIDSPKYSQREEELLADAEANDIISNGMNEIIEETDRLAKLIDSGQATNKDKKIFTKIAEERKRQEGIIELSKIGVKADALNDSDYIEFEKNLNPKMSIKDKYEMYLKVKPKKKVEPIGSMKNTETNTVKDSYTAEEISKLSLDDLSDPKVWDAVRKSMTKQN